MDCYSRTLIFVICLNILGIQGLNESCSSNDDCATQYGICKEGMCKCEAVSYASGSRCLQYALEYKGYCEESEQCQEWLGLNSLCKRNECVCDQGYTWYLGECQAYVGKGATCDNTTKCFDKNDMRSLKCDTGECICDNDYYDRGPDCRRKSSLGNACVLDIDCQNDALTCSKGKCTKKTKQEVPLITLTGHRQRPNKQRTSLTITYRKDLTNCESDEDCAIIANSLCSNVTNKCTCLEDTFQHNGNCVPGFQSCNTTSDCSGIKNSICFKDTTCICKQGYFLHKGNCIAELGVQDPDQKSVEDCLIKPAAFENNACYCRDYWFPREDKRYCIKTTAQEFQNCMENEWCDAMGPYSCCDSYKCKCSSFAKLDKKIFYCTNVTTPEGTCLRDSECEINEHCLDEKCVCLDQFIRDDDGNCKPNLGGSCTHTSCFSSYICLGGVCGCSKDSIGLDGECWKYTDGLNETCEKEEQCQNIPFSSCTPVEPDSPNKTCSCVEGYIDIENECVKNKKLGDPCMTTFDCTRVINKSYQCRNSICQCPLSYTLQNGYCKSGANTVSQTLSLGISILMFVICRWI